MTSMTSILPRAEARLAISLTAEIWVASRQLLAYLISSAVRVLTTSLSQDHGR